METPTVEETAAAETKERPASGLASKPLDPSRPVKIPSLNPYLAPNVCCTNRECRRILTPKMTTDKGGELLLRYDCVPCNYTFYSSTIHAQGICKPLGSDKAGPPEARR